MGEIETWKPVVGFEGFYEVSDLGIVRSLDRLVVVAGCKGRPTKGRVLKPAWGGRDHNALQVQLRANGKRRDNAKVAHIVLEAFSGPRPAGLEAAHGDGDPSNNRPSNLRWATHAENESDKVKHGTLVRGERHFGAKLTDAQRRCVARRALAGEKHAVIAADFGVSRRTVGFVARSWVAKEILECQSS